MQTHKKSWKHVKMVKNLFWWPFLCTFDSCCVCICDIAHFQLLPGLWMHPRVPAPVFRLFFNYFHPFLAVFIYFQPFPITLYHFYPFPIIFICFQLFLPKFECSHIILPIFSYHFWLFSAIFDHFHPCFITLTRISSPSTIMTHFRPPLFIFNHFRRFTITLTHFISQIWTRFWLLLFISDH